MSAPTTAATVVELPAELRSPLRKQGNKALMVAWINVDLLNRCGHDVRTSYILYDADGTMNLRFGALYNMPRAALLQELFDKTDVRYWSKGVV